MRVLSIGNSFSQDAQSYLHQVAENEGVQIECVNLYIGGCSLMRHWENLTADEAAYQYERNGEPVMTGEAEEAHRLCSIREALEENDWDFVTFQQASHDSGKPETYQPYLSELSAAARKYAPNAAQLMHQTWAYAADSTHEGFRYYGCDHEKMYASLKDAYSTAAAAINARIIPSGDVIQRLRAMQEFDSEKGGASLWRDGFHMSLTVGRYALAALWFTVLTGYAPQNDFIPDGSGENEAPLRALIRDTIKEFNKTNNK